MQDLTIALAQVNQAWEDKTTNLAHFAQVLDGLSGADLILLPEMFHTGFTMNGAALAETMDDSPALNWLREQAARKNAAIYASFIVRENDRLYNRGVFMEPSGERHVYDKRKTFNMAGEGEVYASGTKEQIVQYKGWKINLQICYDLRFPENVRNGIAEDGHPRYDLLLYVANWPERRVLHWDSLLRARAIENQCYVAGVNRVGTDANALAYSGGSVVYNALGTADLSFAAGEESVQKTVLSFAELQETRSKLPFLIDSDYRSFNR